MPTELTLDSCFALQAPLVLPAGNPFGEKVVFIANDWQVHIAKSPRVIFFLGGLNPQSLNLVV